MLIEPNLCYKNFFKNKNISKKLKLRLKNTVIEKMSYAPET